MKQIAIAIGVLMFMGSCTAQKQPQSSDASHQNRKNLPILQATLYHQTAAEMRALAYQAFNLARLQLDRELRKAGLSRQQAIVVDIDETVLDNSPFEGKLIQEGTSYPDYWAAWIKKQKAEPIPGSVDFLNYADKKGISVFYVSNRHDSLRAATKANLKSVGFPQVKDEHIFLKTTTSSKVERRQRISGSHDIVMLMGDNLNDFSAVFEGGTVQERYSKTDSLRKAFGSRFIVLPNAMYGEWEGAAIDYHYELSPAEKVQKKLEKIDSFD